MHRSLRITVSHDRCVGNGQCVATAPAVFAHNEEVQSVVIDPRGAAEDVLILAAVRCPTGAIRIEDAATGETIFPRAEQSQ